MQNCRWQRSLPSVGAVLVLCLAGGSARPDTAVEEANKQAALAYYDLVFNAKDYEAAAALVGPSLVQHTARIGDGALGLRAFVAQLRAEQPQSRREIKRVLTDADTVIIQAHLIPIPGERGAVVGDILRFDQGKVVEQWGVVHPITANPDPNNANDVFGSAMPAVSSTEAQNKAIAIAFYDAALNEKDWSKAKQYLGPRYTQHSIYMQDGAAGLEGLVDRLKSQFPDNRGEIKQAFVDGDMVALHLHVTRYAGHPGWSVIELMRVENAKVVEHWDIFEPVPERAANSRGMF